MRHARSEDLDRLEPPLMRLRRIAGLSEESRGTFYRGSRAFLHFHEHQDAFIADVRLRDEFERFPVTSAGEKKVFLAIVEKALNSAQVSSKDPK